MAEQSAPAIRTPRTKDHAQRLLQRYAEIDGAIAARDARRDRAIARINAIADLASEAMIEERYKILEALGKWWESDGHQLLDGKRKSLELGGCVIGSKAGKDTLGAPDDEKLAAEKLSRLAWAQELIVRSVKLDKVAILKSVGGAYARQLRALGFKRVAGIDVFFVKPTGQGGTQAKVSR